jgi:FOG: Ankyrin repeat
MKPQTPLRSLRSFAAGQCRVNSCLLSAFLCVSLHLCGCLLESAFAATNDLTSALQKGLFEEEANHNYSAAIEAYQGVINRFDEDRKLAATAIFRVGEIYRKQGKTNEANAQYERVVREFSDQSTLATFSQSYLSAGTTPAGNPSTTNAASESTLTSDEAEEVRKIRALIRDSPDLVNAKDENGQTRLHTAASLGHITVARFLLDSGADPNVANKSGQTPLYLATQFGHKSLVELLLAHGAKVQIAEGSGYTPLHIAANKGFRSIIDVLLAHGADVTSTNWYGSTPLHLAVANGFKSIADLLLNHQADVNAQTSEARDAQQHSFAGTPLHIAVARSDQAIAELLLANKANPNSTNGTGDTPLHFTAQGGNQKIAELLLANKAGVDPINNNGATPLALAASAGHTNVASTLLSHGADVNARNPFDGGWKGWTPLIYAVSASRSHAIPFLLKSKADPNVKTENQAGGWAKGFTPLLIACSISGMADSVAALLDAKADPNLETDFGQTPTRATLYLPVALERKRVMTMLLNHRADIETRDEQGKTLLMLAAQNKDKETVELLLSHKADVSAKNHGGLTALHIAVISLNNPSPAPRIVPGSRVQVQGQNEPDATLDIVAALLAAGANPNVQSNEGKTALNYLEGVHAPNTPFALGSIGTKVRELLIDHGAIFDLPRLDAIEVRRPEVNFSKTIFTKGTNGWDKFTLFELIGVQYPLLSASPVGEVRVVHGLSSHFAPGTGLDFPEFKHIRIRHLKPDFKTWDERTVDIEAALASGDCAADVPLELGDQVEIPEADHVLNARWIGLDKATLETLKKCLTRHITILVKGQSNSITLGPDVTSKIRGNPVNPTQPFEIAVVKQFAPFMIKPALNESKLLLASSDLSHIKLIRTDPKSGQKRELIVDCSYDKPAPSVWLRDGDIIEVPDKP